MAFFRRNRQSTIKANVDVEDIKVVTSMIISSSYDGTGGGTMCFTVYFLAVEEDGEYYELFSGKKLEKEKQTEDGFLIKSFDTPYVNKAEPLSTYLINPTKKTINLQYLLGFITQMNLLNRLEASLDEGTSQEC